MSNAKDLGHPGPVGTIQKTENQVKLRREDQILSEGEDQIRQIDCKAVVRFHSFLHLMSNAKDLGHPGPVKTIQKTENQVKLIMSNAKGPDLLLIVFSLQMEIGHPGHLHHLMINLLQLKMIPIQMLFTQ